MMNELTKLNFILAEDDILRELERKELIDLENLYKNQSKHINYHYLSIYNQIQWNIKLDDIANENNKDIKKTFNLKPLCKRFFTHRHGNLLKNGTYFSIAFDCKITISLHSLESSFNELIECLKQTKLIPWKSGPLFAGVHASIMPIVEKIVIENEGAIEKNRKCIFYLCENKIARNLTINAIDEKYKIRPLSQDHITYIHNLWPNNKEASIDFLAGLILLNKSFGIFFESFLIGWIFQNEFSGIGILHVITEERRKGFAKVLAQVLTKEIALSDEKIDVSAFTVYDNLNSQNLLEKIGYSKTMTTYWMQLK